MVLFLLNPIFVALSLISRLIFTVTAYLLVLAIQSFKVPGEAFKGVLDQVADLVKSCVGYIFEFALDAITRLVSALFEIVKEGVFGSVAATGSAIGGLAEQMRDSVDGLLKDLVPVLMDGLSEMVSTIVTDFWNNYKDAIGYVTENIA